MKLFPLFGRLAALRRFAGHADPGDLAWETDPLSHPALRRMTPDQLADLPIGRGRHSGEEGGPLRAVTLSSGGLAEVFRSARVTGDGTISLQVPIDQVDDILKSLVVQDTAGTVVGMTLGGASPIEETFRRLPFSPEELGDVGRLAGALQGTAIKASSAGRMVSGRSLGMSVSRTADGKDTRLLSVLADDGTIQVIELGGDATITILDETMRQKV